LCEGRVRDCSVKPTARVGIERRKGEDLQRKARPQATPMPLYKALNLQSLTTYHYQRKANLPIDIVSSKDIALHHPVFYKCNSFTVETYHHAVYSISTGKMNYNISFSEMNANWPSRVNSQRAQPYHRANATTSYCG
jgi:hypothetical protein